MKRILIPLFLFCISIVVFAFNVSADSTITIPMPERAAADKQVTISLRIPPNTEPLTGKEPRPKVVSRSSLIVWDANPSPKIPVNDELNAIFEKFAGKGWIKGNATLAIINNRPMDKITAIRVLQHLIANILEIAQSPDMVRTIRKSNLVASDIEDLRRMIARFSKELVAYCEPVKKVDKDLLMLQERFKTAKSGVLKVIKVEGAEDGGTVIHLTVD
ncbi:MAG: hypothetical protein HQM09_05110 [Candidatus Riflebacteria bacterium]|nr:hypothetical protein [Candidatus Riflebacteria bacterium]